MNERVPDSSGLPLRAMVMVLPSRCWISIERSGDSSYDAPSICDWKVTAFSVSLRKPASDIT